MQATITPVLPSSDTSATIGEANRSTEPLQSPCTGLVKAITHCTQEMFRLVSSIFSSAQPSLTRISNALEIRHGGMTNPDNCCYLNATVQALLASSIDKYYPPSPTPLQKIARDHLHNFRHYIKQNVTVPIEEVMKFRTFVFENGFRDKGVNGPKDTKSTQEDAHELCLHLLELLGMDPFQYYEPVFYESSFVIPPLDKHSPLTASIITVGPDRSQFYNTLNELLSGVVDEEEWEISQNKTEQSKSEQVKAMNSKTHDQIPLLRCLQLDSSTAPHILPIHIQRFEHTSTGLQKKESLIAPSETLEIRLHDTPESTVVYQLAAVMIREGDTVNTGHFYTYIPKYVGDKLVWIECNDAKVMTHMDLERPMQVASESGYLYFYRRRSYR